MTKRTAMKVALDVATEELSLLKHVVEKNGHGYSIREEWNTLDRVLELFQSVDADNFKSIKEYKSHMYQKIMEIRPNPNQSSDTKFKCPIDYKGCKKNCGSYGCGN